MFSKWFAREQSAGRIQVETQGLKDAAVTSEKVSFFKSTEQTGSGAEQSIAHGLGRTPTLVIAIITEGDGNPYDLAEGVHDATNVKITAGAAVKYKVVAL